MSTDAASGTGVGNTGAVTGVRAWPATLAAWATGRRGRWRQVVLWTIVVLVLLRVLAPWVLTLIANRALANGDEIRGSISGLTLHLLTCDYTVHGLELRERRDDERWHPLLEIDHIHSDLAWGPLLRGALMGHVTVHRPVLHMVGEKAPSVDAIPVPPTRPVGDRPAAPAWQDALRTVVRVRLTAIDIVDGQIRYHDPRHQLETAIEHITARIEELVIPEPALTHRCPFHLSARTPGHGTLVVDGDADILAKAPTFLVRARLEGVDLPALNPLTRHFSNLTFDDGSFEGYTELVADGRRVGGYLKVLFRQLEIGSFGDSDPEASVGIFWGAVVKLAEDILENEELKQHAARIPLSGELDEPEVDVWTAIGTALRNAFIRGLTPGFESTNG